VQILLLLFPLHAGQAIGIVLDAQSSILAVARFAGNAAQQILSLRLENPMTGLVLLGK
jgi:putative effector of murein hydrolase LrgA (UPF0299 family)